MTEGQVPVANLQGDAITPSGGPIRRVRRATTTRPPERAWVPHALYLRGRTLTELAQAWNVSAPTISKWLDGSVTMSALTFERAIVLADMLDISLAELAARLNMKSPTILSNDEA